MAAGDYPLPTDEEIRRMEKMLEPEPAPEEHPRHPVLRVIGALLLLWIAATALLIAIGFLAAPVWTLLSFGFDLGSP